MIQVAVNGSRKEVQIPVTHENLCESAIGAVQNGASSIHIHIIDFDGKETLGAEYIDRQISMIRELSPEIPVGISTGEWIEPNVQLRLREIKFWNVIPDFVSVNYYEKGYKKILRALNEKGIGVEAGLKDLDDMTRFLEYDRCFIKRILIEPETKDINKAINEAATLCTKLSDEKIKIPILVHGLGATTWPLFKFAIEHNYETRIGMEDTLRLPDGRIAKSNAELVRAAFNFKNDLLGKSEE